MKTFKARVHVKVSGWVTVERQVHDDFDPEKRDVPSSLESNTCDDMADEALSVAGERLGGECDGFEVLP